MTAVKCATGSPSNCQVTTVPVSGYSAGNVVRVTNGLRVYRSTEKNSCPSGWKIWSPRNKNDWTLVYNALGKNFADYPNNPQLIVDVTRNQNGCPGCKNYAMNSGVIEQVLWQTSDGSAWWLRNSRYNEPSGDYHANCYLEVQNADPNNVQFRDSLCNYGSSDYLCQIVASTWGLFIS